MSRIEMYWRIIDKDEFNVEAWFLLGEEYLRARDTAEALEAFSNALKFIEYDDKEGLEAKVGELLVRYFSVAKDDLDEPTISATAQAENSPQETKPFQVIEGKKQSNVINLEDHKPERTTFQDVGGLEDLKTAIDMKIIKPFINPGLFSKFKKKTGGGILLYGPPGCGKTFIAKATAGEIGANFYPVHITDILDPYIGVSEQNLHNMVTTARANRPAVLFFDEIDTIGYSRSKATSEHLRPLVDSMLTEMEGVNTSTDKLLIIGATNMPWDVDAAFKRPGRFDKLMFVPPPDKEARKVIFELKLRGKPLESGIILDILAEKTEYYSGADIENVIEIATENVLTEIMETNKERLITMDDLINAIESSKPSTIEWLSTIKNYIKYSNQTGLYSDVAKYLKEVF